MSRTISVPWVQRSHISMSLFYPPPPVAVTPCPSLLIFLWNYPRTAKPVNILGLSRTCAEVKEFLHFRRPHHKYRCDAPWRGRPFFSPGHVRLRRLPHSHHNRRGYYNIVFTNETKKLSTITTPFGKYKYNHLPMGVCIEPGIFMEKMSALMDDLEFSNLILTIFLW